MHVIFKQHGPIKLEDLTYMQNDCPSIFENPIFTDFISKTLVDTIHVQFVKRSDETWIERCLKTLLDVLPLLSGDVRVLYLDLGEEYWFINYLRKSLQELLGAHAHLTSITFYGSDTSNNRYIEHFGQCGYSFYLRMFNESQDSYIGIRTNDVPKFLEHVHHFDCRGFEDMKKVFNLLSQVGVGPAEADFIRLSTNDWYPFSHIWLSGPLPQIH